MRAKRKAGCTVARIPWGVESELRIAVTRFDNGREMIDVRIYRDERAPLLDAALRDDPGSHRSGVGRGVAELQASAEP
jgi:hypothetical protein